MKNKTIFLITLAVLLAGVFYFIFVRLGSKQPDLPFLKKYEEKKEEPIKDVAIKLLFELEKEGMIKVVKEKEEIFIETENKDLEKIINENQLAKNHNIKAIKSKDIVLFQRDNDSFTVFFKEVQKGSLASKPKMAIVIDDIGNSKELGEELFKIKGLTFSILPDLPYSKYFSELAKEQNIEVMLHIPLEPKDPEKYGKADNLITTGMSDDEIIKKLQKIINSLPNIKGANNHMGSKFTENNQKMKVILKEIKQKNLFFLDSRTSPDSVAYNLAKEMGIKSYKRDIFLDHEVDEGKIKDQLNKAVDEAVKKGYSIAIGHPHKETIKVLKEMLPYIENKVDIVTLSSLSIN